MAKVKFRPVRVYVNTGVLRRGVWEVDPAYPGVQGLVESGLAAWLDHKEEVLENDAALDGVAEEGEE